MSNYSVSSDKKKSHGISSISRHLPLELRHKLIHALGPSFEFYMECELKSRDPENYVMLSEVDDVMRNVQSIINAEIFMANYAEIIRGDNIHNEWTLSALYNWSPGVHARHLLRANPMANVVTCEIDGGCAAITEIDGHRFFLDTFKQKLNSFSDAIMRECGENGEYRCKECRENIYKLSDHIVPPPLKLTRQTARSYPRTDVISFSCDDCNKIDYVKISY